MSVGMTILRAFPAQALHLGNVAFAEVYRLVAVAFSENRDERGSVIAVKLIVH